MSEAEAASVAEEYADKFQSVANGGKESILEFVTELADRLHEQVEKIGVSVEILKILRRSELMDRLGRTHRDLVGMQLDNLEVYKGIIQARAEDLNRMKAMAGR